MGSRSVTAVEPRAAWGTTDYILAYIADNAAFQRYEQGGGRGRRPKPLERPKAAPAARRRLDVDGDRVMRLLHGKRS